MTWQRHILLAIALMSIPVFYAPYEWGNEILQQEMAPAKGHDRAIFLRQQEITLLRKSYPKRERQFLFGGPTRVAEGTFNVTLQRRLVTEQLVLECLLIIALISALGLFIDALAKIRVTLLSWNVDKELYLDDLVDTMVKLELGKADQKLVVAYGDAWYNARKKGKRIAFFITQWKLNRLMARLQQFRKK